MSDKNNGAGDNGAGGLLKVLLLLSKKFDGKSEDELVKAILEEAERRKKAGTLTDEGIERFCNAISPFLSPDKRTKLTDICKKNQVKQSIKYILKTP